MNNVGRIRQPLFMKYGLAGKTEFTQEEYLILAAKYPNIAEYDELTKFKAQEPSIASEDPVLIAIQTELDDIGEIDKKAPTGYANIVAWRSLKKEKASLENQKADRISSLDAEMARWNEIKDKKVTLKQEMNIGGKNNG